jgi:sugar transferase (PEP-CTERM/EpsH1 system associated)
MSIRVMHVVNNLEKGGLENGLVNLIQGMDEHRFEHIVCTIRGFGANADRLPHDRVQLVSLAETHPRSRIQTPALVRAIRRFAPDVVHSRNWSAIEAVAAARVTRVRGVVHSEHGLETSAAAHEPTRRTWLRRAAYEIADRVLAVSFQLRRLHATRTGFPEDRITVIHNGVDHRRFSADEERRRIIRAELGINSCEFCVGSVANLLPVKDHMTLLAGFGKAIEQGGTWRLLLVGEGPERARLTAFIDIHPALKDRVTFLGSSSRVPDLLRAMDVFVLPSVSEGICNALLEAMSTGLPVIATNVGGNPEVVVDRECGLLFPVGDVTSLASNLVALRLDADVRRRLGQGALQRMRAEFSLDSMIRAYEGLYASLQPMAAVPAVSAG